MWKESDWNRSLCMVLLTDCRWHKKLTRTWKIFVRFMKSLSLKLDLHHSSETWQKIINNGSQKKSYYVVQILCKYKISYLFFYPKPDNFTQSKSFENRKQFWFDVIILKASNILGRWVTGSGSACSERS